MLPPGWDPNLWAEMALAAQDAGAHEIRDRAVRPMFQRQKVAAIAAFGRVAGAVDRSTLEAILRDIIKDLEDERFRRDFAATVEAEFADAARTTSTTLGLDPSIAFDLFDAVAVRWAGARTAALIEDINSTTEDALRGVFAHGLEAGSSLETLRRDVEDTFSQWEHGEDIEATRAMRIARTEVVSAQNAGVLEGFDASGLVTGKTWQTLGDSYVRASHQSLDGLTVGLDAAFPNGLQFPGDPDHGGASDRVNCRCSMLPAIEEM